MKRAPNADMRAHASEPATRGAVIRSALLSNSKVPFNHAIMLEDQMLSSCTCRATDGHPVGGGSSPGSKSSVWRQRRLHSTCDQR